MADAPAVRECHRKGGSAYRFEHLSQKVYATRMPAGTVSIFGTAAEAIVRRLGSLIF